MLFLFLFLFRQGVHRTIGTPRVRVRVKVRVNRSIYRHSSSSGRAGAGRDREYADADADADGDGDGDVSDVAVFWDFENCPVPSSLDPFLVRRNIERALRKDGLFGPISLRGYGNIQNISRAHVLEALSETGVGLHHVPYGGKNSSDRALLIDMLLWTIKHSPPAHVLLISGDSDFSILLHKMRMLSYDVLLAAPNKTAMSTALVNAANRVWVWPDIALGHNGQSNRSYSEDTTIGDINKIKGNIEQCNDSNFVEVYGSETSSKPGCEDMGKECLSKLAEAQCLPSIVVNKIINIVEERPGISLGSISKELRHLNLNPRSFGFTSFYHLLISMKQLQTSFVDGLGMKDRVTFYLTKESRDGTCESALNRECVASEPKIKDLFDTKPDINEASGASCDKSPLKEGTDQEHVTDPRSTSSWRSWLASLFRNA